MTVFEDTEEVIEGPSMEAQATPPGWRTEAHSAAAEEPWQLRSAHAPPENAERLAQLSGTLGSRGLRGRGVSQRGRGSVKSIRSLTPLAVLGA